MLDQSKGSADALIIAGLLRNIREHIGQVFSGVADPFGLRGLPVGEMLSNRQAQQFSIGELVVSTTPHRWVVGWDDFISDENVQCYQEGV